MSTAVEFLFEQLITQIGVELKHTELAIKLFKQAKEMERQQVINAVSKGWDNHEDGKVRWIGEQHYNETYKKEIT
jgi:hypothetical protein